LKIFDCQDPAEPLLLSTTLASAIGVSLNGSHAYVHRGDSLFVVDITDLAAPFILGRAKNPPGSSLSGRCESVVANNFVFWAGGARFGAFDVSNPNLPEVVFADFRWGPNGVHPVGDTLFVADEAEGVLMFRYKSGISSVAGDKKGMVRTVRLLPNYPNPFNATTQLEFVVDARQHIRIDVFNLLGQHAFTVFEGVVEAGEHMVDFSGSGLSSGIYFYRLESQEASVTGRISLIK
jgi:hypothetical protein